MGICFCFNILSAQVVKERLFCQAVIGNNTFKDNIMNIEVVANFIQPLLDFSERSISFTIVKVKYLLQINFFYR